MLIYVNNKLDYSTRNDHEIVDLECIWFEIKIAKNNNILISSMCRPPSANEAYF